MMRYAGLMIALLGAAPGASAGPFDWLVGNWCVETARGRTCEHWAPVKAGRMEGGSTTVWQRKVVEREVTTIRLTGPDAVYDATPTGAVKVSFAQTARGPRSVSFENHLHDYPQRIRYWRKGADLLAEISLADGRKAMRWHYRRTD